MSWYNNPLLKTYLQMILKKSNQRIVQLGSTYGTRSTYFKQATSVLKKGAVQEFASTSASGYPKIDIRKINKLISSGKADRKELNQVLSQIAGIKITETGDIEKLSNQGIKTVKEIRKATAKRLANMGEDPREYTQKEIDKVTEALANFEESFETTYEVCMARVGEKEMKNDQVTRKLWGENRGKKGRLTYSDMTKIMERMGVMMAEANDSALSVEKKNGGNV